MADQKKAGMLSGMDPLAVLTGDELLEVSQLGIDGVWKTYSILVNKIRTNQGLSAYEIAVKNGFQGTEQEWLLTLNGKSAYELAKELGFQGTEAEWLTSLVGPSAYQSAVDGGFQGTEAEWLDTLKGKSAYQIAVANGFVGTEAQWLATLKGKSAYQIAKDLDPTIGTESEWLATLVGDSAYQVAVKNGFVGSQSAWLASLKGQSAYQIWVAQGNVGDEATFLESLKGQSSYELYKAQPGNENKTEAEFLASLKGKDGTNGTNGTDGVDGADGKSAYEVAVEGGFVGDEAAWLVSLKGEDGAAGADGTDGEDGLSAYQIWESKPGNIGKSETEFLASLEGTDGKSAYDIAVEGGYVGTEVEWVASLQGVDGQSAYELYKAQPGNETKTEAEFLKSLEGKSAYEVYKAQPGNSGKTEAEFIASLKGAKGDDGKSAYQSWLDAGNVGSEQVFLNSLKGANGADGADGSNGQSINVIATVTQEEFDQIVIDDTSAVADAYVVDKYIYIYNGVDWVKSNSIQGPQGQGLNYLGTWPTGTPLPPASDVAYKAGDTYVWGATAGKISLWTLVEVPTRQWVDIGVPGPAGKSAYQSWLDAGNVGTEIDFVNSLKGKSAYQSWVALPGNEGKSEAQFVASLEGTDGTNGADGKSAYQTWLDAGNTGSANDFLNSLKGADGVDGTDGTDGASAFDAYKSIPGNENKTVQDFMDSLKGVQGDEGLSAFEVWQTIPGNEGKTLPEYIADITGPQGIQGKPAVAFTIVGQLGDISQLPPTGDPTEAYYVGSDLYVWVETAPGVGSWQNFGSMNGESAFQLWLTQPGNEGKTEADFLDYMEGDSAYELAVADGYVGTQTEWLASLKGKDGKNLQVNGTKADAAAIQAIPTPAIQEAWIANDTGNLWIYNGTVWIDAGPFRGAAGRDGTDGTNGTDGADGTDGVNGKSAYDQWLEEGNVGTAQEFLDSLKGQSAFDAYKAIPGNEDKTEVEFIASLKGADGVDGTDGTNGTDGAAGKSVYQIWLDAGNLGTEAEFLATLKGADGKDGTNGTNGTNGADGKNVVIKGSVPTLADLNAIVSPAQQDAYTVQETNNLYMYINTAWVFLGKFQGPQGEVGQQGVQGVGINIIGEVATYAELSTFPDAEAGDAVFVLEDHKLYQRSAEGAWSVGIQIQGPQGEQGEQGIQGEMGPAISIMGSYATEAALKAAHPTGTPGEAYLVGPDLYLYGVNPTGGATEWYNAGPIQGPIGPQGIQGKQGLKGNKGDIGERGSLWITLPAQQDTPTAANGRPGDWAVNASHRIFYKIDDSTWGDMGPLVAGDVNSPLLAEGKVVRLGTTWVPLPIDAVPSPTNGTQYVMKGNSSGGTDWAILSLPAAGVEEVPANTTVAKGRTSSGWVSVMALPTGQDATKRYELLNGAWVLSAVQAASPATLNKPLCYRHLATGLGEWVAPSFDNYSLLQDSAARTASFTPDFTQQQTFRINAANDVTVTLGQFTAGRVLMAVFVMEGSTNKLKMATTGGAQIGLNGGTALADIEYGATQTVITAFWNGFGTWIVAKGPSY